MIADGESVSLDGLPDQALRMALQDLLERCGLEQAEMEADDDDGNDNDDDDNDDDDDDGNDKDDGPSMGYALPDDPAAAATAQQHLARIASVCQTVAQRPARIQGPKRPPTHYQVPPAAQNDDDDEEEEGPSLVPRASAASSTEAVKVAADRRSRQLSQVAAGQGADLPEDAGGREEWMVTPGKSDVFDFIKKGQPIKSRKFQAKAAGADDHDKPMDPAVRAEMDAIMQAHASARGPSLMEEHQAARKKAKQDEQQAKPWNWTRDKDLDAGRRIDKANLQMVLGGAATGLKSKFQGGFHGAR